ncbi:hypothetical protein [Engelhardtia mirabilis]|uniref:Uncharacterized protein n=1 Tax=Engelhardtia mirabilis TaxID=2528011 RepID=A0A518BMZ1_9BACT|nr:hypothetical protein Pla133_34470 [Planctomycetes bacterium Pla133]QDV02677.1 hypothetical protein Pla86_34460 [Planctomycetes bacterium Pla86]
MFTHKILLASTLAFLSPAALAGDGGFATGDLWLRTSVQSGTPFGALVRVDASTGESEVVLPFTNWHGNSEVYQTLCYDPRRDRILVYGVLDVAGIAKTRVWAVDAKGQYTETSLGGSALAPASDGKVYAALTGVGTAPFINFYDTADVQHPLLNAAGTGPFAPGFTLGFGPTIASLIYDPGTHSLLWAVGNAGSQCAGPSGSGMGAIYRLDLSPDGTRVVSSSCTTYDLDGANPFTVGGYPMGFGRRADGKYVLTLRGGGAAGTNDDQAARMVLVDPATLSTSTFASNGPYTQALYTNAGTWSRVRGEAVIFDPAGNQLRAFALGEVGGGTLLASGAIGSSSDPFGFPIDFERAGLIEIAPLVLNGHLSAAPTTASIASGGLQSLSLDFGAASAGSIFLVLGSVSGAVPPTPIDGKLLPLAIDSYLLFSLSNANSAVFVNTLGVLDGAGKKTAAISVPTGLGPALAGLVLHHAALTLSPIGAVTAVSDAVSLRLVP